MAAFKAAQSVEAVVQAVVSPQHATGDDSDGDIPQVMSA